ncbi:MAG: Gfo/Idh/MocA family oxidoreductase [Saprospiraceae bacterium]
MEIKFAVVGCGYISNRHGEHIQNHPEARLIGGFDIKPERTAEFAQKFNVKGYESLEALLADPEIDIVNVCTPNGNHHEVALKALEAGKHALVEKPMAIKKSYCEDMIKTALDNNKELFVVKQNRFNPPVMAVKQLMKDGRLGEVYNVVLNCYWNRNELYYTKSDWKGSLNLDGGTLYTQFSHFIDIVYYLFGDFEITASQMANVNHGDLIDFEDTGNIAFRFTKNGALGSMNYTTSCYKQNMEGSITIFAENATIKIGGKYLNTIDYQVTNDFDITDLPVSGPANNYGYYEGSMSNHDKIIHNVVEALNRREKIMTNAYEGLKVVEIIEKMYQLGRK